MDLSKSEFFHFGILPRICIYTPIDDEYSQMYMPHTVCECGSKEWKEEDQTMILGHLPDGTPMVKDVHRCKSCDAVRMADHIGKD